MQPASGRGGCVHQEHRGRPGSAAVPGAAGGHTARINEKKTFLAVPSDDAAGSSSKLEIGGHLEEGVSLGVGGGDFGILRVPACSGRFAAGRPDFAAGSAGFAYFAQAAVRYYTRNNSCVSDTVCILTFR